MQACRHADIQIYRYTDMGFDYVAKKRDLVLYSVSDGEWQNPIGWPRNKWFLKGRNCYSV